MITPVLEAKGLTKRFGGVHALSDVDFRVMPDEVVGIIGPNGSGKTTLFNVLSGFMKPGGGSIRWRGDEITNMPPHRRARAGLIRTFQESMVFPGLTVRENVAMALRAARLTDRESLPLDELVEYVRITHVLDSLANDLSWGQSRLLGIALALAMNPTVLLLDEPFAGLSPVAAEDVSSIIAKMHADGYSLCVIDHEMSFLLPICDRLVVLTNGSTLADGTPQEVIDLPEVRTAYLGL